MTDRMDGMKEPVQPAIGPRFPVRLASDSQFKNTSGAAAAWQAFEGHQEAKWQKSLPWEADLQWQVADNKEFRLVSIKSVKRWSAPCQQNGAGKGAKGLG